MNSYKNVMLTLAKAHVPVALINAHLYKVFKLLSTFHPVNCRLWLYICRGCLVNKCIGKTRDKGERKPKKSGWKSVEATIRLGMIIATL